MLGCQPSFVISMAADADAPVRPLVSTFVGKQVTAADVHFSFLLYTGPGVAPTHARGYDGIDLVLVRDPQTAVGWWHHRHPE